MSNYSENLAVVVCPTTVLFPPRDIILLLPASMVLNLVAFFCFFRGGASLTVSTVTLLAIEENDANWHCFAPKIDQMHFINQYTVEEDDLSNPNYISSQTS